MQVSRAYSLIFISQGNEGKPETNPAKKTHAKSKLNLNLNLMTCRHTGMVQKVWCIIETFSAAMKFKVKRISESIFKMILMMETPKSDLSLVHGMERL